ncbi:MAG TPA: Ig-like domain-containing protein [Candidatus Saccharimonadales bacterium]|nr:Ig-like domain-containing protein [Candidatus Saccharimonadales bacterium]
MRRSAVYTIRDGVAKKKRLIIKVFLPTLVVALGVVGILMITGPSGATASPVCVNDTAGANDEPGQKDLTKLCVDYAGVPTTVQTLWNWDETGTNGANTMDACSLFDTDGDGNINYSVCVSTINDPAQLQTTTTYSCGDAKTDRCTSTVTAVSSGNTGCSVSQVATDPFPAGASYPTDTQGTCTVDLTTVGGASAKLIDVCSYPSGQPNSDPSDCVIAQPKSAKLEVKKHLIPATDPGLFNLQVDGTTKAANVGDNGTTGEVIVTADTNKDTHSIGEIAGTNTQLSSYTSSIECKDQNGTGNVVASSNTTSVSVTVTDAADIVCIITNTRNMINTTTTTQVHNASHQDITSTSVALGTAVHDSATVGTQVGNTTITGNVTYHFYTDGNCDGTPTDETVAVGTESTVKSLLGAGLYSYKAEYGGDSNYNSSVGICEPFTIDKSQLAMESKVHNSSHVDKTNSSVPLGSVMHDTAKITGGVIGGFTPSAITFRFYTNGSCVDGPSVNNIGADEGDATRDRSAASAALAAGSYSYKAFVAGDSNYIGSDSGCEPFTVDKAQLAVTTNVHDSNHNDITNDSVATGSITHDTATVTGQVNGFDVPTVSFTLTGNFDESCTAVDSVANNGTEGGAAKSADSSSLGAGVYAYQATVAGDNNYYGATGDCEPFTVNTATPDLVTTPNAGNGIVGVVLHDSANLTGGYGGLGGTITFNLFDPTDTTCSGEPVYTEDVNVNGAGIYDTVTGFVSNAGGIWRWQAVYNGDGNNDKVIDNCDAEQMTLSAPPVVLGEHTDDPSDPPPVVLAATLTNTGTPIGGTSLIAAGLLITTLAFLGYSRFSRKQN